MSKGLPLTQRIKLLFGCVPDTVVNVAAHMRDGWVAEKAHAIQSGARVLDAGAGECRYRKLFEHCHYTTQDFGLYQGTSSGPLKETWAYGGIDHVCDIAAIPVPDASFEVVLCTEVLEHVPDPINVLRELSRVLAPSGSLLLTAPLSCGLHQEPYHFYGGYTPHFYRKYLAEFGLNVVEIRPMGGLLKHVAQEVHRAGRLLKEKSPSGLPIHVRYLLLNWLPRFLSRAEDRVFVEEFTIGYMVEARKRAVSSLRSAGFEDGGTIGRSTP